MSQQQKVVKLFYKWKTHLKGTDEGSVGLMVCFLRKKWKSRSGVKIEAQFLSCLHFGGLDLSKCSLWQWFSPKYKFQYNKTAHHLCRTELKTEVSEFHLLLFFSNKTRIEEKNSILILLATDIYYNLLDFVRQDLRKLNNKISIITNKWNTVLEGIE